MRILIASDTYHPSVNGAAYFTYRLATILAKNGHQVSVIAPSKSFRNTVERNNGVTVYGVRSFLIPVYPDFRISPLFISKRTIRTIVGEIKPDIIHIQNHFMIGRGTMEAARELGVPILGTNHFMPENLVHYFHLPLSMEKKLKRKGWDQFLEVYRHLDLVTAPTKIAADMVNKVGLKKKVMPVSCGIDLNRFSPRDKTAVRKKFLIPNKPTLLYAGRLDKEKNVDLIIKAMPLILKRINAQLVIAGSGKLKNELEELAVSLGLSKEVIFTGFIPDQNFHEIYNIADVFVIAGTAELQSIVTMEAMASGLPVIAANAVALPELVHDGQNGFLFPPRSGKLLAKAAIRVLRDKNVRRKMAKKSLEIIKNHDINKVADKFHALYVDAIMIHGLNLGKNGIFK